MIHVTQENGRIIIKEDAGDFAPKHESQLAFWGFKFEQANNRFVCVSPEDGELASKLVSYLQRMRLSCTLDANIEASLATRESEQRL